MVLSRTYDAILTVDNAYGFYNGLAVMGNTSGTVGIIANVNFQTKQLKVRIANTLQEFTTGEAIHSNVSSYAGGPVQNTIYFSNTVPTIVRGNSYIVDGNTAVFPLPANYIPVFFDVIHVAADGVTVPSTAYVWPASNLNEYGIEFLPRTANNEIPEQATHHTTDGHQITLINTGKDSRR